jgi:uncharacterized membrane protein
MENEIKKEQNKRYWLRGGLIGLVIGILQFITLYSILISQPHHNYEYKMGLYLFPLFGIIIIFLGIIIGFIYGKIKNRRKK